jgi:hypothetical protein
MKENDLANKVVTGDSRNAYKKTTQDKMPGSNLHYHNSAADVRDIANIEKLNDLPKLLSIFSSRRNTLTCRIIAFCCYSANNTETICQFARSYFYDTYFTCLVWAISKRLIKTRSFI